MSVDASSRCCALLRAPRRRLRAHLPPSPSARPTCARSRPELAGAFAGRARARGRLRHRLVDAARRARRRALAGHRPEPRDDGHRARQAAAGLRALRHGRRVHARTAWAASASTPRSPAAGGATCRWRAWHRWLEHAARAAGARRARGLHRQRASSQASSTPIARRDADGNSLPAARARRRQRRTRC
ncbi:MAG: hypothetical protein MZW92_19675 [Comamonadaceae bacterium]|nr:hypothetical protein [Comamonadaceae bacterium]